MAWESILHALWLFLPAYVANMSPVFTAKLFPWWGRPIDGGKIHKDGKRVLGDGKTWRGLIGGGITAGGAAVGLAYLANLDSFSFFAGWDFGLSEYAAGSPIGSDPTTWQCDQSPCHVSSVPWFMVFGIGFLMGILALTGDAVESYFKRRSGRDRGAPWFPFDQLDFVVFGLIAMVIATPLSAQGWMMEALFGNWIILTTLIVGTPVLHISVNRIGYWLKLKEVPW